jgi:hypothetical protein
MTLAKTGRRNPPRRQWQALGAVLLAAASLGAPAAQKSASFKVMVDLISDAKDTVQCDRTTRPSVPPSVTVVCVPAGGQATTTRTDPRFMLNLYESGAFLGTVDGMMSTGTVTSWRVVHLVNRDYLEIMVGW